MKEKERRSIHDWLRTRGWYLQLKRRWSIRFRSSSILKYTFVPLKRTFIEKFPRFRTKLSEFLVETNSCNIIKSIDAKKRSFYMLQFGITKQSNERMIKKKKRSTRSSFAISRNETRVTQFGLGEDYKNRRREVGRRREFGGSKKKWID